MLRFIESVCLKTTPDQDNDVATLTVTKRDFLLFPNRYLKQLGQYESIVVTNHGIEEFVVTKHKESVELVSAVSKTFIPVRETKGFTEFGCGCLKDGGVMCKKHGRV